MQIFDLADRFPKFGAQLQILMKDESCAIEVIDWIEGYIDGMCDAGIISWREKLEYQASIAMSIGIKKKTKLKLVGQSLADEA